MLKFMLVAVVSSLLTNYFIDVLVPRNEINGKKLFSAEEIATFNGENNLPLYLVILGNVYDVTSGAKYYGKGETYHAFIGKDNSKSFVVGNFEEDSSSDDVIKFSPSEFRSLNHWVQFYKKKYPKVGKMIGRFYNAQGKLTPYGKEVKNLIKEAELAKDSEEAQKKIFPPCNIEWEAEKGTRLWCTNKSGGIERDWVGVPRELYEAGNEKRCACIHEGNKHLGNIKEYENCDPESVSCYVQKTD